jgi:hypothetical protein
MTLMSPGSSSSRSETAPSREKAGVEGNSIMTSVTGLVLLPLLAVEGFTLLDVRGMITLHIFLGTLLIGPVLLKVAATSYRFARYYRGAPAYVRKGPPQIVLRFSDRSSRSPASSYSAPASV